MNKLIIILALLGIQETNEVCFRKCEIKDQWGVIHHDNVKKYDNFQQFLATNPPKDTWVCVDENIWGTKIFASLNSFLKSKQKKVDR
tara:strand:- start:150 stop:410 length:261 start_codon:yes stop_codon:yes gene_type:complete